MKVLTFHVEFAGIVQQVDIDIVDLLLQIKNANQAVYIETILDIFSNLDLDNINLEQFQIAIMQKNLSKLNKLFNYEIHCTHPAN